MVLFQRDGDDHAGKQTYCDSGLAACRSRLAVKLASYSDARLG